MRPHDPIDPDASAQYPIVPDACLVHKRMCPVRSPEEYVSNRMTGDVSSESRFDFYPDGARAHLFVCHREDSQDGGRNGSELPTSVRPTDVGLGSTRGFAELVGREILKQAVE